MTYLKNALNKKTTPQSQPIPGSAQVANSAGGYSFAVDDWTRLSRFLVLGAEGGTYYVAERTLTLENAEAVTRCIAADGPRVVREIVAVSEAGTRAQERPGPLRPRPVRVRRRRRHAPGGAGRPAAGGRIGTHLFHFAEYVDGMRGWGRGLRQAVGAGTTPRTPTSWRTRRSSTGSATAGATATCCAWRTRSRPPSSTRACTTGSPRAGRVSARRRTRTPRCGSVWASERAKRGDRGARGASLIRDYRLPREAVPTQWLTDPAVWEALLEQMPMTALIRNLATLTRVGLLTPQSEATREVIAQVTDEGALAEGARPPDRRAVGPEDLRAGPRRARPATPGRRWRRSWTPWTRRSTPRSATWSRPASAGCWRWTCPARWAAGTSPARRA